MTHGSLFSGIGGFDLASEWMGWDNKFHCEWNEFGQKVLHYYWPEAELFTDITKSNFTKYANKIDILTGGFPCQPYSSAGKRLGKEDSRHLWPEMLRAIREIQPRWIVGENVRGLTNWNGGLVFDEVQSDLEAEGYEVLPFLLPACAVNAPHRRDRIWFVAHSVNNRHKTIGGEISEENGIQRINREEMECRNFDRASLSSTVAHSKNNRCNQRGTRVDKREVNQFQNRDSIWDKSTTNGEESNASYSNSNGLNKCNSEHEVNTSKGGEYAQRDIESSNDNGNVADTNSGGTQSEQNLRQKVSGKKRIDRNGTQSDASDTTNIGRTNALENGQMERGRSWKSNQRNTWDTFPSVTPICIGDDGISNRLDNITFSKWRNESIKAGGNAIVPQVVYQIFKAIEEYELILQDA